MNGKTGSQHACPFGNISGDGTGAHN